MKPKMPQLVGQLEPGNIDYLKRPIVHHPDKSYSTTYSMSFEEDGKQVLVPSVSHDGRMMKPKEAIDYYHKTGEHLGKYDTPANADVSATNIHNYQAQFYTNDGHPKPGMGAVDTLRDGESNRLTPFTEMYPPWDVKTFNASAHYIQPAKATPDSPNRSTMGRIYENVLNGFSQVRQQMLEHQMKMLDTPTEPTQVWGTNG